MTTQTPSSTTVDAGAAQTATPAEIAAAIINDTTIRADGVSHRQRVACVLTIFGAATIDFEEAFDYTEALSSYEPHIVEGWRQLAVLQSVYVETLYIYQWIDEERYKGLTDIFAMLIHNINYHLQCLLTGEEPKPLVVLQGE